MPKPKNPDIEQMREAAGRASALMKILGHRGRLMILCHLAAGEMSVGALAETLQISQSTLSQHLARMRAERLVETRRESQTVYYRLVAGEAKQIIDRLYEVYCPAR